MPRENIIMVVDANRDSREHMLAQIEKNIFEARRKKDTGFAYRQQPFDNVEMALTGFHRIIRASDDRIAGIIIRESFANPEDGLALLSAIKKKAPNLPVMYIFDEDKPFTGIMPEVEPDQVSPKSAEMASLESARESEIAQSSPGQIPPARTWRAAALRRNADAVFTESQIERSNVFLANIEGWIDKKEGVIPPGKSPKGKG